jgi:hypothetical protein
VVEVAGEFADPVAVGDMPDSYLYSGNRVAVLLKNAARDRAEGREPKDEPREVLGGSKGKEGSFPAGLAGGVLIEEQIAGRAGREGVLARRNAGEAKPA